MPCVDPLCRCFYTSPPVQPSAQDPDAGLYNAIRNDSALGVEQALSGEGANPNYKLDGITVLHLAVTDASITIIEMLLEKGAYVNAVGALGWTPLHVAAGLGKIAAIYLLVDKGADIHAVDFSAQTPMWVAIKTDDGVEAVEALVANGVDVNAVERGDTPLRYAVRIHRLDLVKVLLRMKADPMIPVNGVHAFSLAMEIGNIDILKEMLPEALRIDDCGGPARGVQLLSEAVRRDKPHMIRLTYDAGARDTNGEALCHAINEKNEACVKALLDCIVSESCVRRYVNGARNNGCGWLGHSLHGKMPSVRIMRLLVNAGVDTVSTDGVPWRGDPPCDISPTEYLEMAFSVDCDGVGEAKVCVLRGIHRLFLQVPAVHATSWLWPKDAAAAEGKRVEKSTAIVCMLPVLKRRAAKPRVLLAAVTR